MKLKDIYSKNKTDKSPVISYEIFPPKDDVDGSKLEKLFSELNILLKYNPSLISVTYGAGGSNQNLSIEIIRRIKETLNVTPMPHFTCVATSKDNISSYLKNIERLNIENILALRGDIPKDGFIYNDFKHANELVSYIKEKTNLCISVAGYPEGHKESKSLDEDIAYLKQKTDCGADVIYTQLFFDNSHFFKFVDICRQKGIVQPIIPGILPVTSYKQVLKMTEISRVEIPQELSEKLEKHKDDKDYIKKYGIEYASKQCQQLYKNKVQGLHFYTLNKAEAVSKILENINQ